MAFSISRAESDAAVSSALNFDVIKARASQKLGIPSEEVTDQKLGDLFGLTRETIGRLRLGKYKPALETVIEMGRVLELSLDQLINTEVGGR
jgi:DNA-binding XRE family transcriptional regulator